MLSVNNVYPVPKMPSGTSLSDSCFARPANLVCPSKSVLELPYFLVPQTVSESVSRPLTALPEVYFICLCLESHPLQHLLELQRWS